MSQSHFHSQPGRRGCVGLVLCFHGGASAVSPAIEFLLCVSSPPFQASHISQLCCSPPFVSSHCSCCLLCSPCTSRARTSKLETLFSLSEKKNSPRKCKVKNGAPADHFSRSTQTTRQSFSSSLLLFFSFSLFLFFSFSLFLFFSFSLFSSFLFFSFSLFPLFLFIYLLICCSLFFLFSLSFSLSPSFSHLSLSFSLSSLSLFPLFPLLLFWFKFFESLSPGLHPSVDCCEDRSIPRVVVAGAM